MTETNQPDLISVGKCAAPHGTGGELIVQHVLGSKKAFKPGQALMVELTKGSRLPYFVASAKAKSLTEQWVKLEEVDSREQAARLTGKMVWLPAADVSLYATDTTPISMTGYQLFDGALLVGTVAGVIEQPHQVLLEVDMQGKEALIPLHQETLKKVDHKARKVVTQLPEGLLDLYR